MVNPVYLQVIPADSFNFTFFQGQISQMFWKIFFVSLQNEWDSLQITVFVWDVNFLLWNLKIVAKSCMKLILLFQWHTESQTKGTIASKSIQISKSCKIWVLLLKLEPSSTNSCVKPSVTPIAFPAFLGCFRAEVRFLRCATVAEWVWVETYIGGHCGGTWTKKIFHQEAEACAQLIIPFLFFCS